MTRYVSESVRSLASRMFNRFPWEMLGFCFSILNFSGSARRKFRKLKVGYRSYIDPSVQILGWENVKIGSETIISEGTWLNINFRERSDMCIHIGNSCHIGRRNFLSCGPRIEIKDYCMTSVDCHFLGCGHKIDTPMIPYNASGPSPGKTITVGVNCWLGASVTILEGVEIGCGSVIGAGSLVTKNIPPFSIAVGNPCAVIKRFDFVCEKWVPISEWHSGLEEYMPNETQYLILLKDRNPHIGRCLITSGRRFGWI